MINRATAERWNSKKVQEDEQLALTDLCNRS
jgi:hypothetical protein